MESLYVIELQQNKWYIGKTRNFNNRMDQHVEGDGASWTKKYGPMKSCSKLGEFPDATSMETLKTLEYMYNCGINNVRGAEYCQLKFFTAADVKNLTYAFIHRNPSADKEKVERTFMKSILSTETMSSANDCVQSTAETSKQFCISCGIGIPTKEKKKRCLSCYKASSNVEINAKNQKKVKQVETSVNISPTETKVLGPTQSCVGCGVDIPKNGRRPRCLDCYKNDSKPISKDLNKIDTQPDNQPLSNLTYSCSFSISSASSSILNLPVIMNKQNCPICLAEVPLNPTKPLCYTCYKADTSKLSSNSIKSISPVNVEESVKSKPKCSRCISCNKEKPYDPLKPQCLSCYRKANK